MTSAKTEFCSIKITKLCAKQGVKSKRNVSTCTKQNENKNLETKQGPEI